MARYSYECTLTHSTPFIETGATVTLNNGEAVVNRTGGVVGLPATSHGLAAGTWIWIANTVAYNGYFVVLSASTTHEIRITATYAAETLGSDDVARVLLPVGQPTLYQRGKVYTFSAAQNNPYLSLVSEYEPGTRLTFAYDDRGQDTVIRWPDPGVATAYVMLTSGTARLCPINLCDLRAADGAALGLTETAGDHYLSFAANVWALLGEISNGTVGADIETSTSVVQFRLPAWYVPGGAIKVRVRHCIVGAGTTAASTIDCSVYKQADGAVGSDLVTTAAAATVKGTWTTTDFTVTPTGLVAGDVLNLVLTSVVDNNNSTNIQAQIDVVAVVIDAIA